MRLVLGETERELNRAAKPPVVVGDKEHALPGDDFICHASPELHGALARERMHEAHRRVAFDAIDQHVRERVDERVVDRLNAPDHPFAPHG